MTHKWEDNHNCKGYLQGVRGLTSHWVPQPRTRAPKGPDRLVLEASGTYVWESCEAVGNRDSVPKGCKQNLTDYCRSSNLKRS